eukprot:3865006-Rhodomonas_salina.4
MVDTFESFQCCDNERCDRNNNMQEGYITLKRYLQKGLFLESYSESSWTRIAASHRDMEELGLKHQ